MPSPALVTLFGDEPETMSLTGDQEEILAHLLNMNHAQRRRALRASPELMGFWAKLIKGVVKGGIAVGKGIGKRVRRKRARRAKAKKARAAQARAAAAAAQEAEARRQVILAAQLAAKKRRQKMMLMVGVPAAVGAFLLLRR